MKTDIIKKVVLGMCLAFSAFTVRADFTINPNTYNGADTTKGMIWFDVVGTTTGFDGAGLPLNVNNMGGGGPGNSTINYKFLFTQGSFTAFSAIYQLDSGANYGNSANLPSSVTVVNPNVTSGAATYQVYAWVGGSDYNVGNTKNGFSTPATAATLGGGINPAADLTGFSSFAVTSVAVPEPTTLALGLFGAAGLLIRRRK